jgi:L-ribulose-5-phosphate 3-epimerase
MHDSNTSTFSRRQALSLGMGTLGTLAFAAAAGSIVQPAGTKHDEKASAAPKPAAEATPWFTISLAQWSLHSALYKGELTNLDFPRISREVYAIDAVEYVNAFFNGNVSSEYIGDLKKRCADHGVSNVLIMCDGEGALGAAQASERQKTVENHRKWVEAAAALGCHSIRVNAQSEGTFEEQQKLAADGLRALCEVGEKHNINILVENHGGLSSNGAWLAGVMKRVEHKRVGTLPDFGNFNISSTETYDMYKGTQELMPFAKGVSAKSHDFDEKGEESGKNYMRLMRMVKDAGYRGRVGIEYEGKRLSEKDGILATKALLERVRTALG